MHPAAEPYQGILLMYSHIFTPSHFFYFFSNTFGVQKDGVKKYIYTYLNGLEDTQIETMAIHLIFYKSICLKLSRLLFEDCACNMFTNKYKSITIYWLNRLGNIKIGFNFFIKLFNSWWEKGSLLFEMSPVSSVQCRVSSVRYVVYSVQFTVYSVQYPEIVKVWNTSFDKKSYLSILELNQSNHIFYICFNFSTSYTYIIIGLVPISNIKHLEKFRRPNFSKYRILIESTSSMNQDMYDMFKIIK